jgi:hypothetical protein
MKEGVGPDGGSNGTRGRSQQAVAHITRWPTGREMLLAAGVLLKSAGAVSLGICLWVPRVPVLRNPCLPARRLVGNHPAFRTGSEYGTRGTRAAGTSRGFRVRNSWHPCAPVLGHLPLGATGSGTPEPVPSRAAAGRQSPGISHGFRVRNPWHPCGWHFARVPSTEFMAPVRRVLGHLPLGATRSGTPEPVLPARRLDGSHPALRTGSEYGTGDLGTVRMTSLEPNV